MERLIGLRIIERRRMLLFVLTFIFVLQLAGCSKFIKLPKEETVRPKQVETAEVKQTAAVNAYAIHAELNPEEKRLDATQQVVYVNSDKADLQELYFHVYANAFRKKETAPFLFDDFERAYSRGFKPGYSEIQSIELLDKGTRGGVTYSFQGEGDTILKVVLPEVLKPGESVTLEMKYQVFIPPAGERFGYGGTHFNLGNWYPVAAVYDETGWNLDKYYAIGDPFYSDAADYAVTVKAPKEYVIAASGRLEKEKTENESRIWHFEARNMRDFAFIANTDFQVAETEAEGILVKSYYYKDHEYRGKKALDYAKESIEIFNDKFGKYPYPVYSVVETEFPSGMEYPGLVYISDKYYDEDRSLEYIIYTVVHETAHQWWYAIVGNDQIDEAWLDEGFATYSEVVYTEAAMGRSKGQQYYEDIEAYVESAAASERFDGKILKPLSGFRNWDDYGPAVYNGGAMVLEELRKQVGDDVFYRILQAYYDQYRFKIATTEDFIRISETVSSTELDPVFDRYLKN